MPFRRQIAYICFLFSNLFKSLGKFIITKEKTIVVDALTLPGWFIVNNHIIFQSAIEAKGLKNGFGWETYVMPEKWCDQMDKLTRG